jgi:uncharacterized protein (DUF2225 family)
MTVCSDCLSKFNVGVRCPTCQAKFWRRELKVDKLRQRIRDLESLNACYRIGKRPSEKLLDRLAKTKELSV